MLLRWRFYPLPSPPHLAARLQGVRRLKRDSARQLGAFVARPWPPAGPDPVPCTMNDRLNDSSSGQLRLSASTQQRWRRPTQARPSQRRRCGNPEHVWKRPCVCQSVFHSGATPLCIAPCTQGLL